MDIHYWDFWVWTQVHGNCYLTVSSDLVFFLSTTETKPAWTILNNSWGGTGWLMVACIGIWGTRVPSGNGLKHNCNYCKYCFVLSAYCFVRSLILANSLLWPTGRAFGLFACLSCSLPLSVHRIISKLYKFVLLLIWHKLMFSIAEGVLMSL